MAYRVVMWLVLGISLFVEKYSTTPTSHPLAWCVRGVQSSVQPNFTTKVPGDIFIWDLRAMGRQKLPASPPQWGLSEAVVEEGGALWRTPYRHQAARVFWEFLCCIIANHTKASPTPGWPIQWSTFRQRNYRRIQNLNHLTINWNPERWLMRMPYQNLGLLAFQFPMALTQILFLCVTVSAAAGCTDFPTNQGASAPNPPHDIVPCCWKLSWSVFSRNEFRGMQRTLYIHSNVCMARTFSRMIDPHWPVASCNVKKKVVVLMRTFGLLPNLSLLKCRRYVHSASANVVTSALQPMQLLGWHASRNLAVNRDLWSVFWSNVQRHWLFMLRWLEDAPQCSLGQNSKQWWLKQLRNGCARSSPQIMAQEFSDPLEHSQEYHMLELFQTLVVVFNNYRNWWNGLAAGSTLCCW